MLLAFGPEDLERLAIPIGIGIAALLFLLVPSLRKDLMDSYRKGKEARENHPALVYVGHVVWALLLIGLVVWFILRRG